MSVGHADIVDIYIVDISTTVDLHPAPPGFLTKIILDCAGFWFLNFASKSESEVSLVMALLRVGFRL